MVPEKERDTLAQLKAPGSQCSGERLGPSAQPLVSPFFAFKLQAQFLRGVFSVADERLDYRIWTRRHHQTSLGKVRSDEQDGGRCSCMAPVSSTMASAGTVVFMLISPFPSPASLCPLILAGPREALCLSCHRCQYLRNTALAE